MFCTNCGSQIDDKAVICVKCGVAVKPKVAVSDGNNEWLAALLLCIFLGGIGIHRFYTKNNEIAIAQLILGILSCGSISAIWALVDLVLILTGNYRKGNGELLKNE